MVLLMKFGTALYFSAVVLAAFSESALAFGGRLSPRDFNKMYWLASQGKVAILREAVSRGLNIDATNPNGDTGLCIAVKRKDYTAYNTFRQSGANPRHACTYEISKEYREFLYSGREKVVSDSRLIVNNKKSLYYDREEYGWWPWILGGAAVGGLIWGLSGSGGGGGGSADNTIAAEDSGYGLATLVTNTKNTLNGGENVNSVKRSLENPNADSYAASIKMLPDILSNSDYLLSYITVSNGGYFENAAEGTLQLGDATVGASVYGEGSQALNNGNILLDTTNGAVGMVASNGGKVVNGPEGTSDSRYGNIDITFRGSEEGDAAIGMYGDTSASLVNSGRITGISTKPVSGSSDIQTGSDTSETEEETETANNSGSIIGMALFDIYTGKNMSGNTVSAENSGIIDLSAGYNSATDVAVSLIGMGSYIDEDFLNSKNNPAFAEKMNLTNTGDINLKYQGTLTLAETALKLGQGGLIGIRADAATTALNHGDIDVQLTNTTMTSGADVAAGMLSVHGAALTNGDAENVYTGTEEDTGGTIRISGEATAGGVSYGMLAAKGEGTQSKLYNWQEPVLTNYGLVDMQVSNGYAMASFSGGDVVNNGVINLGVENGQSRYTNSYGLYAAGEDKTKEVLLENNGIINVYAEQSTAIYNAFSGSVTMQNDGMIYVSNKATDSKVFGGNFSSAYNNGSILYKVGNSDGYVAPDKSLAKDSSGNTKVNVVASAIGVSGDSSTTKQLFVNNQEITIGETFGKDTDYGGTYATAAVQVSKQGAANNNGTITLVMFDKDISQFNVGMWLDSTATAESYANNYGNIVVNAVNSVGIRNDSDSDSGGTATNFGKIYVNGAYGYGMAATQSQATIFNGRSEDVDGASNAIYVNGEHSVGMYVKDGTGYNYGTIYLNTSDAVAYMVSGENASFYDYGQIVYDGESEGVTIAHATNKASVEMNYPQGIEVENFTLGKATDRGLMYLSKGSTVYAKGVGSYALYGKDSNSVVSNNGTIYAYSGANPIYVYGDAVAYNDTDGKIYVEDSSSTGIYVVAEDDNNQDAADTAGHNKGEIVVQKGKGIYVTGLGEGTNKGTITVQDDSAVGISGNYGADIKNAGVITVEKGTGISLSVSGNGTDTSGENSGTITVTGAGSVGVKVAEGTKFTGNEGSKITVSCEDCEDGETAYGIYNEDGTVENGGMINVGANSIGMASGTNSGSITLSSDGAVGMVGGTNQGNNDVEDVTKRQGIFGDSGVGMQGGTNSGLIKITSGTGMVGGSNLGTITISSGKGMEVTSGSSENSGTINVVSGNGAYVNGGSFTNSGTINIGSGNGIYLASGTALNSGTIALSGSGYGVKADGGTFVNSGTITYYSKIGGNCSNLGEIGGTCTDLSPDETSTASVADGVSLSKLVYVGENGSFVNSGTVDLGTEEVDFDELKTDETGSYVLAAGGTYKAESFKGDVVAAKDIVMNGFEDTYVNKNSFEGQNNGLNITSESYMFTAEAKDKDDVTDVELNRKKFEEITDDKELANFFETNYKLQHNEKMYNALKSAETQGEFDTTAEVESGKNFYAALPRENMAVLRGLNAQEQGRILENGLNGGVIGADYFRTGKDAQGSLSGYADNVYSPYIGFGTRLSSGWSIGGTLRAAYADADYDEARSSRDNKILLAFMPILYQHGGFKFLTTPSAGAGYGTYKRHALSGSYDADTLDFYYGLYNHAEYSIDMKVAELVTEAELNLQGSSMSKAEEDGGLNLEANDSLSMEAGVGLKLRKRIQLAKDRSLMLALGTKYYHEFLNPYKNLRVGMDGSPVDFGVNAYDEDKNRLKTTAEAIYKDGDFSVAAEVSHNAEKESSIEGGIGVRYGF